MIEQVIQQALKAGPEIAKASELQSKIASGEVYRIGGSERGLRDYFAAGGKAEQLVVKCDGKPVVFEVPQCFYELPTHEIKEILGRIEDQGAEVKVVDHADAPERVSLTREERSEIIGENRENGKRREAEVKEELQEKYPEKDGYTIEEQVALRNKDGNVVYDPVTGERRIVDIAVVDKDGNVVEMREVTSPSASKEAQMAKESRIREAGGNYIRTSDAKLVKIPQSTTTELDRRP